MTAGIDPGRWKIGVAFADDRGELLASAIVPSTESAALCRAFENSDWSWFENYICEGSLDKIKGRTVSKIFIGNGTSSKDFSDTFPLAFTVVNEYGTTLEAREIYLQLHKPKGIMRLIPSSLCTPPRHIDDLAAYAILRRGIATKR